MTRLEEDLIHERGVSATLRAQVSALTTPSATEPYIPTTDPQVISRRIPIPSQMKKRAVEILAQQHKEREERHATD